MSEFGLVAGQINRLSDQFDRESARERADSLGLSNLKLQQAGLSNQRLKDIGLQNVQLAKAKRDQYLSEAVTIGQAIDTHPKWTDEQKQFIKNSIPEKARDRFLNFPTTRGQLNTAMMQLQKNYTDTQQKEMDRTLKKEEGRLNRQSAEKIAGMRTTEGQPTKELSRMKVAAWKSYMDGKATPEQEAMIGVDKDQFLSQAARIVSQDYTMFGKPPEELVKRISDVADKLRSSRQQNPKKEDKQSSIPQPPAGFVLDENSY